MKKSLSIILLLLSACFLDSKAQNDEDPFITNALTAIQRADAEAIEGLRDMLKPSHVPVLAAKWRKDMPRKQKDAFISLLMDQHGDVLTEMMEDGLNSPDLTTRYTALEVLLNDSKLINSFIDKNGMIDGKKVDKEIEKYKKEKATVK